MKIIAYLPNFLSFLRIVLSPLFALLFLSSSYDDQLLGVLIFTIAALTDTCDGYLARRWCVVTVYGAFLDPLADKLLIITGLACLWWQGIIPWWLVTTIMARDVLVTWLRKLAQRRRVAFVTSWNAKIKTVAQFVGLYVGFATALWPCALFEQLTAVVMPLVTIITLYTGVEYGLQYALLQRSIK